MKSLVQRILIRRIAILALFASLAVVQADDQVQKFIAVLQSNAPQFDKIRACQQLAALGSKDAIPALVALLPDDKLNAYARTALEATADPAVDQALRQALPTLQGNQLCGAINSLGVRRDAQAVDLLAKIVTDHSAGAAAALAALGRIANPAAIGILQQTLANGPAELRPAAADAALIAADLQRAAGQTAQAVDLCTAVRQAAVPKPYQMAGLHGVLVAGQAPNLLFEALRSDDRDTFRIALAAIREMPAPDITAALVAELPKAKPEVQALLIPVLATRTAAPILPAIEALVASPAPDVRRAALQALGQIGAASSVPLLLQSITASATPPEAAAAAASLIILRAPQTDALLLQALPAAEPGARATLIGILDKRNVTSAVPELLKQADQGDAQVSKAAFAALVALARPEDFARILQLCSACKDETVRQRAEQAAFMTCRKVEGDTTRSRLVLAALHGATTPAARCSLLRILGGIGNYPSYQALRAALADGDRDIRNTAVGVLSNWPDPTPTQVLLDAAANTVRPVNRMAALSGALRLAAMGAADGPRPSDQVCGWFATAAQIAATVDEKRLVLAGVGQWPCVQALQLAGPYLEDPQLKTEAALAIIQIAPHLLPAADRPMAKGLLEKVSAATSDQRLCDRASAAAKEIPGPSAPLRVPNVAEDSDIDVTKLTFQPLFDGQTFAGWEGDTARSFRIQDRAVVGGTLQGSIPRNEFLCTTRSYTNFVLRAECKLIGNANGGIQIRTHRLLNCREVTGYQADMDTGPRGGYWGSLYDESRRGPLAALPPAQLVQIVKPGDWNRYEIRCHGPHIELFLNGVRTVDFTEKDNQIPLGGIIALQIHAGSPSETWYRNITIAELP